MTVITVYILCSLNSESEVRKCQKSCQVGRVKRREYGYENPPGSEKQPRGI